MPSLEELGQKVKAKYPEYKDIPDGELGAKVKAKYPDAYKDFAAGSTFDKISVSQKAKANLASMESGPAKAQFEKAQSSATQDIKNYYTRAIGETAAMAPFAAASVLTAGTSLPVGAAIMGGLGLAGGLAREGVKKIGGSSEVPKGGDLALALGADVVMGAGGEAVGRLTGIVGKTLIPKLITRAAAQSDAGKLLLENSFSETRQKLYEAIQKAAQPKAAPEALMRTGETQAGSVFVDVERPLREAYDAINRLPKAPGAVGQRFSGMTPKAAEVIRAIEKDLHVQGGNVGQMQPLDGLVRVKGDLQQFAYDAELNTEERTVFKKLAADLHVTIKKELKALGPEPQALYDKANDLGLTLNKAHIATTMAERFVQSYAGRMALGGAVGGGYGGYMGRSPGSAAVGAAAGAGAALAIPRLSTLILQQAMSHPQASKALSRALEFAIRGDKGRATDMAGRAFAMAGVRETIKEAIKQQGE